MLFAAIGCRSGVNVGILGRRPILFDLHGVAFSHHESISAGDFLKPVFSYSSRATEGIVFVIGLVGIPPSFASIKKHKGSDMVHGVWFHYAHVSGRFATFLFSASYSSHVDYSF